MKSTNKQTNKTQTQAQSQTRLSDALPPIKVSKKQAYSIYQTDEITRNDILWNEYVKAAGAVSEIINNFQNSHENNNIVAFCGDRGSGKTSAMVNFGNELLKSEAIDQKFGMPSLNNITFIPVAKNENQKTTEELVIDPSILDGNHGILDIVLPSLFSMVKATFNGLIEEENHDVWAKEYESLIIKFQEVFRQISILEFADTRKLYDENMYRNIDRLNDLSSAVDLKLSIKELFSDCISFIFKYSKKYKNTNAVANTSTNVASCNATPVFLLMLDDVDLCCANAFRILEEIRKYLMIPNLVILMAIRIEQMELSIRDRNYAEFANSLGHEVDIEYEINTMAYKYMLKVLPESRRISLDVFTQAAKAIFEGAEEPYEINYYLCQQIYNTTGAYIFEDYMKRIRPVNLRSLVRLLLFASELSMPDISGNDSKAQEAISLAKIQNAKLVLTYISEHFIKNDSVYIKHSREWKNLIESPAEWLFTNLENLLHQYGYFNEITNITSIDSWNDHISAETEQVKALATIILALKYYEIEKLPVPKRINLGYWKKMIGAKSTGQPSFYINTKDYLLDNVHTNKSGWLSELTGQNSGKLSAKLSLLDNDETDKLAATLYRLLLFTNVNGDTPVVSKTTSSFINKTLEVSFGYFLENIQDLEYYAEKTGLDHYFNRYDENDENRDTTAKESALDEIASEYMFFMCFISDFSTSIFMQKGLDAALKNGRQYKESFKGNKRYTAGPSRLGIELFNYIDKFASHNMLFDYIGCGKTDYENALLAYESLCPYIVDDATKAYKSELELVKNLRSNLSKDTYIKIVNSATDQLKNMMSESITEPLNDRGQKLYKNYENSVSDALHAIEESGGIVDLDVKACYEHLKNDALALEKFIKQSSGEND